MDELDQAVAQLIQAMNANGDPDDLADIQAGDFEPDELANLQEFQRQMDILHANEEEEEEDVNQGANDDDNVNMLVAMLNEDEESESEDDETGVPNVNIASLDQMIANENGNQNEAVMHLPRHCDNGTCIGGRGWQTDNSWELDSTKMFCCAECADDWVDKQTNQNGAVNDSENNDEDRVIYSVGSIVRIPGGRTGTVTHIEEGDESIVTVDMDAPDPGE